LVDWLEKAKPKLKEKDDFSELLKTKGKEFEKTILSSMIAPVTISDKITDDSCLKTLRAMENGVPYIHSAPFRDEISGFQGIIDLLVRTDHLETFIKNPPITAPNFAYKIGNPYHYVVIDIKFCTLPLSTDLRTVLNPGNFPFYKAQLYMYNTAIGNIQGYTPEKAYILGRRWKVTQANANKVSYDPFDRLGEVVFTEEIKTAVNSAIAWKNELDKNWRKWSIPPTLPDLYPNLCVDSEGWNKVKADIAHKIGDITEVWHLGPKHRDSAFSHNIISWKDPRCNSSILGLSKGIGYVVDRILNINRQDTALILPEKITSTLYDWRTVKNEAFVDFETLCDIDGEQTGYIFMIGVYHNGVYTNFTASSPTKEEELRIMEAFASFISTSSIERMWCWSADKYIWLRAEKNHNKKFSLPDWCDLYRLFISEPIVIKGCLKYNLKSIASAMKKHGFISTDYSESSSSSNSHISISCTSGIHALLLGRMAYENNSTELLQEIKNYNYKDVFVLYEILNFIRTL
jgi:uncharacterized protein YprB with RNaseH-like and TPR domain